MFPTLLKTFHIFINPLQNGEILDRTKSKAFVDDKLDLAKIMIFVYDMAENIVGKGENAGFQLFLLFSQCFQKASYTIKVVIVW